MATWQEVSNYIKSNYAIRDDQGPLLVLEFETERGRTQLVYVMGIEGVDFMSKVRFFSPFARTDQISPSQFAELAKSSIFGLAETAGLYGFVHNSFLADLDPSEVDVPMMAVTQQADLIEKQLGLGDDL